MWYKYIYFSNAANFKLYNTKEEDSLKLCYTILNLGDLEDQLYL